MDKTREMRTRRALGRQGIQVSKSRTRKQDTEHLGGYMLLDFNHAVLAGQHYELSVEDLEYFAANAGQLPRGRYTNH